MVQQVKPIKAIFDFGGIMKVETFVSDTPHTVWMFGKKFTLVHLNTDTKKVFYEIKQKD
jgi:hypothetical protein